MRVKILSLFILAALAAGAFAQETNTDSVTKASPVYRADLGYGQTYRYGKHIGTSPYHVIRAGGTVAFPMKYNLGIETGLKYSYVLGHSEQYYIVKDTAFYNYSGHLLDVPVRLTYTLPIFWGMKLFAYAGPNINIGLAQTNKVKFEKLTDDVDGWERLPFPTSGTYDVYKTKDAVGMNRISIQLGAGGGIQWRNYRIRSGYDWGLNNIGKDKNRPERLRGWHVAFEYEF